MIWRISFSTFSDLLHTSTCGSVIGNIQRICIGVNILGHFPCVGFNGNIRLLKALKVNS